MKCPTCNERAATFMEWGQGTTAFSHTCPHCGERLKASRTSIITFVLLLCTLPLCVYVVETVRQNLNWKEEEGRLLMLPTLLFTVGPIAGIHWWTGSYRKK